MYRIDVQVYPDDACPYLASFYKLVSHHAKCHEWELLGTHKYENWQQVETALKIMMENNPL